MTESTKPMPAAMKMYMGFHPGTPDRVVRDYLQDEFPGQVGRPCGILEWCPYGPLVEQFPLAGDEFERFTHSEPAPCAVFGHYCPAFFVSEPFADPDAIADNCLCDACRAEREASEATN